MTNLRYAITTAALAGTLTLAGCAAAAASATTPSAPASPAGLTHITAYSINTDNPVLTSVVSGAIGDYGPAEEISPGGSGGTAHGGELELTLTRGTFRLDIAGIDAKFVQGTSHEPTSPRTCSTYVSVRDAVPVVPGSGTGAYQGIAGTFAMTLTLTEVHGSPCTTSLTILRQVIVLSGAGTITTR